MSELVAQIRDAALACGYAACGIADTRPFDDFEARVREHMARFPDAAHLYEWMLNRVDPQRTAPWSRSIVVCVRRYGKYRLPPGPVGHIGRNYLADRRIDPCPDYKMPKEFTRRLKELGLRVKRGGVPDRAAGERAGVVQIGRNGFAYSPRFGSWINLEAWRVDAELPPDRATPECPCPPDCRACLEACPGHAFVEPFFMRMDRCVAWLTYSAPHPISPELWERMGSWIYGCDVCQEVCPLNRGKWDGAEEAPWIDAAAQHLTPQALANMSQETYENIVHPLLWYIPEEDLERWHANARRALAAAFGIVLSSGV